MKIALIAIDFSKENSASRKEMDRYCEYFRSSAENCNEIRVFSSIHDGTCVSGLPVESIPSFEQWLIEDPDVVVLFHYCDGYAPFNQFLREHCRHVVIRWQVATPPWLTLGSRNRQAHSGLLGYETIVDFIDCAHIRFWAESRFGRDQLISLGAAPERCDVVFPADIYPELPSVRSIVGTAADQSGDAALSLLFMGGGEMHEGYINAIALADRAQEVLGERVRLTLVVRGGTGPRDTKAFLKQHISSAKSDIVVRCDVSDDALQEFYEANDVFVCLSQNGRLDVSIFEAMRHGLPIVAWATTVLREILVDHPFGFPNYDLDLFASAIGALRVSSVKNKVLGIQEAILGSFTSLQHDDQLRIALASLASSHQSDIPKDLVRPAISSTPLLVQAINTARASLYECLPLGFDPGLVFDSCENITSLYDLKIYRNYLNQEQELFRRLTAPVRKPSITYGPDEFFLGKGAGAAGNEPSQPEHIAPGCLIYAPFIKMPRGAYRCEIQATIAIASRSPVSFEVRIQSVGQPVAVCILALSPGTHHEFDPITIELAEEMSNFEFGLGPLEAFDGKVVFSGITLTPVAELDDDMSESEDDPRRGSVRRVIRCCLALCSELHSRLITASGSRYLLKRQARSFFRRGDTARDMADWLEAAKLYEKGLDLNPMHYGYLVQSAHMHKEAGRFEEAETRYQQALQINPDDEDLYMQIGHFYKRVGKTDLSQRYYQEALKVRGQSVISADPKP